jgi:hypothetical protein
MNDVERCAEQADLAQSLVRQRAVLFHCGERCGIPTPQYALLVKDLLAVDGPHRRHSLRSPMGGRIVRNRLYAKVSRIGHVFQVEYSDLQHGRFHILRTSIHGSVRQLGMWYYKHTNIMTIPRTSTSIYTVITVVAFIAGTLVQCSSPDRNDGMSNEPDHATTNVNNPGPETVHSEGHAATTMHAESVDAQLNAADPNAGYVYADGRRLDLIQERQRALEDMQGLRVRLVEDLTAVRARLNEGGVAAAIKKEDQEKAADLAQGLERVDRALEAMSASTDTNWSEMRQSQLTEVAEVREWLAGYHSEEMKAMK